MLFPFRYPLKLSQRHKPAWLLHNTHFWGVTNVPLCDASKK
jgi:hypothetical protein